MPILSILLSIVSLSVKDCGRNQAALRIGELSIRPVNPNPGDKVILRVQYTVPKGMFIENGTANYVTRYGFIPIPTVTETLCKELSCPLVPGTYTNEAITVWPSGISGTLTINNTWYDTSKNLLACILIEGNVR